jgi:hypothetical protein
MIHPLIDLEMEYSLRRLAPRIGEYSPNDARQLLITLEQHSAAENQFTGLDDRPYYLAFLADLMPDLPADLTPKRAGALCRMLCLTMQRRGPGFVVAWNNEQLEILKNYFKA